MKLLITIFLALVLSACATQPQTIYVPQKIEVPITVKCKRPAIVKPEYTFNSAKPNDLLYTNIGKLAAEDDNLSAYVLQLEAALDKCSE